MTGRRSLDHYYATVTAWQDLAKCKGVDPDLFFPERGEDARPAKAICADCPVKVQCLDYALENHEHHGIWGGTSRRERQAIMRRRRRLRSVA